MKKRVLIQILIVLPVVAVSLLYLRRLVRRFFFEPPRAESEMRTKLTQAALQVEAGAPKTVTLYFPSFSAGRLVPETRQMALTKNNADRIRQVLLALIEGSHQGADAPLPPATTIRGVFLTSKGTAYLDFSKDLLQNFPSGIESETLSIYSVVSSITANVPAVKKVRVLIQGQEVESLDGHADLSEAYVPDTNWVAAAP
ncbi:MAG: GerMN domain-containing protein [Terriglobia bacterium]